MAIIGPHDNRSRSQAEYTVLVSTLGRKASINRRRLQRVRHKYGKVPPQTHTYTARLECTGKIPRYQEDRHGHETGRTVPGCCATAGAPGTTETNHLMNFNSTAGRRPTVRCSAYG